MFFALKAGQRVGPSFSGDRAQCPQCQTVVIAKYGSLVEHHWAHESGSDCDMWSEPMTKWHLDWQETVPEDQREVVRGPHRADIVASDGSVVELQHSYLSLEKIVEREEFYGDRMVWIWDCTEVFSRSENGLSRIRDESVENTRVARLWWVRPRKTIFQCKRPTLLDLGGGKLFYVSSFYDPSWGGRVVRGYFLDKIGCVSWFNGSGPKMIVTCFEYLRNLDPGSAFWSDPKAMQKMQQLGKKASEIARELKVDEHKVREGRFEPKVWPQPIWAQALLRYGRRSEFPSRSPVLLEPYGLT